MTESLLERSSRYIDAAAYEGPGSVNPVDGSFHEVADGLAVTCGFSHVWTGDAPLACQLAEWASQASPSDAAVHAARAQVYRARREQELSLMARGIYLDAALSSETAPRSGDPAG